MVQSSRTFRIFVSSTFSDLKAERNALQEHVFPRLRELCQRHGTSFQAIDLRWGVSEEAALDQQTMRICLEEIARCQQVTPRPNFVILLGDRYGWQPLPSAVPAAEMEQMLPSLTQDERKLALWEETPAAEPTGAADMTAWNDGHPTGKQGWYRLDTNSVPPSYVLQPRPHGSQFEQYDTWAAQVERPLHRILERAARETFGVSGDPEGSLKYTASATHQEIEAGALQVEDAVEHVFGFFRTVANRDDLIASLLADPGRPKDAPRARDFLDLDSKGAPDGRAAAAQTELRNTLAKRLPGNTHSYQAHWTGSGLTMDHIGTLPKALDACLKLNEAPGEPATLCEVIWRRLSRVVQVEAEKMKTVDPLVREERAHDDFGRERARFFVGRGELLARIAGCMDDNEHYPLVIWGESGTGKSALLARAIELARKSDEEEAVIARFIGATPDSSNVGSFLRGLCRQIYARFRYDLQKQDLLSQEVGSDRESQRTRAAIEEEFSIPQDQRKLAEKFLSFLRRVPQGQRLLLFIDALDQLASAKTANSLWWLPRELPDNVRLVVSTLPGEGKTALEIQLPQDSLLQLVPMSAAEGATLLGLWLAESRRILTTEQMDEVLGKFAANGLPLYLKLAFEEARRWKSYERVSRGAGGLAGLGIDLPSVLGNLFDRLEDDANHGLLLVSRAMGYLGAAKNGLTEDEMLDVLSRDSEVLADCQRRSPNSLALDRLPVVVWSRLYLDLEPYLTWRNADDTLLLRFYHRQVTEAVQKNYLADSTVKQLHTMLAGYFEAQDVYLESGSSRRPNLRKINELTYHQLKAALWPDLGQTLTDVEFMEAAITHLGKLQMPNGLWYHSGLYDLLDVYEQALVDSPDSLGGEIKKSHLQSIAKALHDASHILVYHPELTYTELCPRLAAPASEPAPSVANAEEGSVDPGLAAPWLCRMDSSSSLKTALTIPGHQSRVKALAYSQRHNRLVSIGADGLLGAWNPDTGQSLGSDIVCGHELGGLVLLPGGDQGVVLCPYCGPALFNVLTLSCENLSLRIPKAGGDDATPPHYQGLVLSPDRNRILCGYGPLLLTFLPVQDAVPDILKIEPNAFPASRDSARFPAEFRYDGSESVFGEITSLMVSPRFPGAALALYGNRTLAKWDLATRRVTDLLKLPLEGDHIVFTHDNTADHEDVQVNFVTQPRESTPVEVTVGRNSQQIFLPWPPLYPPKLFTIGTSPDGKTQIGYNWQQRFILQIPEVPYYAILNEYHGSACCACFEDSRRWVAFGDLNGDIWVWKLEHLVPESKGPSTPLNWEDCQFVDGSLQVARISRLLDDRVKGEQENRILEVTDLSGKHSYEKGLISAVDNQMFLLANHRDVFIGFTSLQGGELAGSVSDSLAVGFARDLWRRLFGGRLRLYQVFPSALQISKLVRKNKLDRFRFSALWAASVYAAMPARLIKIDRFQVAEPSERVKSISISPAGQRVAVLTTNHRLTVRDILAHKTLLECPAPALSAIVVGDLDGQSLSLLGIANHRVLAWDQSKGFLAYWENPSGASITAYDIQMSKRQAIIGDERGRLTRLDLDSGELLADWPAHEGPISCCALQMQGALAASGGESDSLAKLWDLERKTELARAAVDTPLRAVRLAEGEATLAGIDLNGLYYSWSVGRTRPPLLSILGCRRL